MKKVKYCIVTHTAVGDNGVEIAGPAHTIVQFLEKEKTPFIFIRHSIFRERKTFFTYFDGKTKQEKVYTKAKFLGEAGERLWEGYFTIKVCPAYLDTHAAYIGVDPLNGFWGYLCRFFSKTPQILVAFAADYFPNRYGNIILNWIYYSLDNFVNRQSDIIVAVSERILTLRKKQGIQFKKFIWLPNAPAVTSVKKYISKTIHPYKLIVVSTSPFVSDFLPLIQALSIIKKDFPRISLTIIGSSEITKEKLKKEANKLHVAASLHCLPSMSHEKVFETIGSHGIGLAFYNNDTSDKYYIDSMKARDYMALGLPVIISGDNGTAEDIVQANAGFHIAVSTNQLVASVKKLVKSKQLYIRFREHALLLATERDSDKAVKSLIQTIKAM